MKISQILEDYGAWVAFVIALVAMLGSLYYSEVAGFIPCRLCWYQRILMYPLVAITLVGALRRDDYLPSYVLPLSVLGMLVAGYHSLLEKGVFPPPLVCSADVPCTISYVNYLGFITIAVMAFVAFTLITLIMVGQLLAIRREARQTLPIPGYEGY
ncbi:MAG: disulfide oxidoreductase [Chloroflexota bacterium]|jgi:disulfide bond formation protein DsbB